MSTTSRAAAGGLRPNGVQPWVVWLAYLGFGATVALLLLAWAKFAYNGYLTAIFPGELDYGEGIVWQQALLIPGPRMYGDLQHYPFLVFHYPPFYHLVVRAVVTLAGLQWLVAGRLVSMVSMAATAVFAAAIVADDARPISPWPAALAGALAAGLLFVALSPIAEWTRLMRVDMVALALEFLGMFLALRGLHRPRLLYLAAAVFVLAALTKQTAVLGAAAAFATLLPRIPGRALRALAFAVVLGGLLFAGLMLATDGGFARHTILYNVNRFSIRMIFVQIYRLGFMRTCAPVLVIAAAVTASAVVRVGRAPSGTRPRALRPAEAMSVLYFLLGTASLAALGKTGAYLNYALPFISGAALLTGFATAAAARTLTTGPSRAMLALTIVALLLVQALAAPSIGARELVDPAYRRQHDAIVRMIERAKKPVFSDDMVLLMQAGREVPWEPAIITELASKGLFDEGKIIKLIDAHAIAFMILEGQPGSEWFDSRHSPAVTAAILRNYPVERRLDPLPLRLRQPPGDGS